ncbi:Dam family site-specific DNA-(adenine-N6)-methyltransferase [Sinorhizobium meliloti]|uniref:DNA adenine methylase n=1 Tax=Rhizobium meliloti TaxID=382 RepID=UPI000FD2E982|nr:Dam family site-specific DNA-(adenine-N6)-methyltransferase [Sinorhizobium meliloti]RVI14595.1 Dam family site-specific DNA-(adenine-N6)-methyltransferase [Sinorhizobium meliloti]RVN92958.1 Dam family site-specific DNA-(adenine-N6)-methyltransferase [Sinorhizobium meliloti]RVO03047.1 Dam family site-specific DNA-(adenine-N6)-methyltransferase [Sinorhizobium meliloti]
MTTALLNEGVTTFKLSPFLKWAGGKRWFAERCLAMVPEKFDRYIEPFLGSAAMFFALRPENGILSDLNFELISCYNSLRSSPVELADLLANHHSRHNEQYYYEMRSAKPDTELAQAARFIYLNRTCWNGLYRVNKRNEFNVPIGTKTSVLLPTDDFLATSDLLRNVRILHQDFESALDDASRGDFVFVDPPYTVKHNFNGFVKYNDKIFSWSDQVRLRDAVKRASSRGAQVLVTNANHESIREIYDGIGRHEVVSRASVLSGNPAHRARTEELIIRTWL